jgi:acrosin
MTFHKTLRRLFASPKSGRRSKLPGKSRPLAVEFLEDRLVLSTVQIINGVLTYTAGAGVANQVTLSESGASYKIDDAAETITVTGITGATGSGTHSVLVPASAVQTSIAINLGDKADTLSVLATDNEVNVKAGTENDSITVGSLSAIHQAVTVDGEGGTDTLTINDSASAASTYTITDTSVKSSLTNKAVTYLNAENVTLTAGAQADTFNVQSTNALTKLTINAGVGADKFNLGNAQNRLDDIKGSLVLNGQAGTDTLTLNDQGSTTAHAFTLTSTTVTRDGVALVTNSSSLESVVLNAGSSDDTVTVQSTSAPLTLNMGLGNDTVTIGNNLDAIVGTVTVDGGTGGTDAVVVNDSADTNGNTYVITDKDVTRGTTKVLSYAGAESLAVTTTNLGDTVTVESTLALTPVTLSTGGGSDFINVGKANSLDSIAGVLSIDGQAGVDQIVLNDQGAAQGHTDIVRATQVARSNAAAINYVGAENLLLNLPNFFNIVSVESTSATTVLQGGSNIDFFLVGGVAGTLDNIKGTLLLNGGGSDDVLKLNDSNDANANTYTVSDSSVARVGSGTIKYSSMASLELDAAGLNDNVTVVSTLAATPVSLFMGAGNDTVTLGNTAKSLDGIQSTVSVDSGTGADALVVQDSGDTTNNTYAITDRDVTRGTVKVLSYNNNTSESLTVNAGLGADTITVSSTKATTPLVVNAGGGDDTIKLGGPDTADLASLPTVDGQAGNDTIDYSAFTQAVRVNLGAGTATGLTSLANVEKATGGAGDDILIGSAGNNTLKGGAGRDILIGLGGNDTEQGQAGDDILIGGSTSLNAAALEAIMLEWSRTDLTGSAQDQFNTRVNHIVGGGGKNGATTLDATKVIDDAASDSLTGGGDIDWFFKSGSGPTLDKIVDLAAGERLN